LEWIRQSASGNSEAFRQLVLRHQSNVRGALLRLTNFDKPRSDELAQEVFILAYQKVSSFRFESSFATWLYRLTYNVYVDDHRRHRPRTVEAATPPVLSENERVDLRKTLNWAMARLREEERVALTLVSMNEWTQEEAAKTMGLPLGTLKSHVSRGKEKLKEILIQCGWEVSL
jgi:RNA polymerase sigma-70 factor (ECF subfamily)